MTVSWKIILKQSQISHRKKERLLKDKAQLLSKYNTEYPKQNIE